MQLTAQDRDRLVHACARSAMVLIACELDKLLSTPDNEQVFCSRATVRLVEDCMKEGQEMRLSRAMAMFARRAACLASGLSWEGHTFDA